MKRLSAALQANANMVGRELSEEVRQRALNVAGMAFDNINPNSGWAQSRRSKIKQYLTAPISTRLKYVRGGRKIVRRGSKKNQLRRVHLIAQAIMAKKGRKGLYGKAMAAYTGKMTGTNQKSVGFLKSVFLPLITTLNPVCRFKFPYRKTRDISRWPGSSGFGRIQINNHRSLPFVLMGVGAKARHEVGESMAILQKAANEAVSAEADEVESHMENKLMLGLQKLFKSR